MNDHYPINRKQNSAYDLTSIYFIMETKWKYKKVDEGNVAKVSKIFDLPNPIARIMSLRGIISKNESREFFYPDITRLHNPFLMIDMDRAVSRILDAIINKKTILIFGDYDVDGTTSAGFLTLFFKSINVESYFYIPSRENEGYGVSKKGIDYAKYIGADIIITCDCGINAYEEVKYANSKNIDVIITDHHKASNKLPEAYAIINPNRLDCQYPFKGLCGAGVVFKMALAICEKGKYNDNLVWKNSDVVTLGIAADLVPMQDENRIIAYYGIEQIKKETNLGISALLKTSGFIDKNITIGRLVFWIAPKINAAGRLGDASRAVKLLTTSNPILAKEIAEDLERENNRRKDITEQITNDAIHLVKTTCDLENDTVIVLGNQNWHHGVIGIVASRIKEMYSRPTIIISIDNNECKGSCRSIKDFDLVDALDECKNYLTGYGGHPIAAGLSLELSSFKDFKNTFIQIANKRIPRDNLIPTISIDSVLNLEELNHRMLKFLNALEPYGPGNTRPVFVTNNLLVDGIPKLLGRDSNTIKFSVKKNDTLFESIGFNMANQYEKLIQNSPIDIAYVIGENKWKGKKTIQLELKDIKLSNNYA